MANKEEKKPFFTVSRLVLSLACFVAFLVVAVGSYYVTAGVFVSAELAVIYAALSAAGAVAVLLRMRIFSVLYYVGCLAGWAADWFVSGLNGDFAPTAGTICKVFLIAAFSLVGAILQWRSFQKRREKKKAAQAEAEAQAEQERMEAEKRAEEERRQAALTAARQEREDAELAMLKAAISLETPLEVPVSEEASIPEGSPVPEEIPAPETAAPGEEIITPLEDTKTPAEASTGAEQVN